MRYVPELRNNLLSVSVLDYLGYSIRIEHEILNILHGGVIMAKWSNICELYILDGSIVICNHD